MSKQVNQFRDWAEDVWYESPLEISVWFASKEYAEVFFKLEKSILVAKLNLIDESWQSEKHLHIPLDIWKIFHFHYTIMTVIIIYFGYLK